jgi:hypothetical protein
MMIIPQTQSATLPHKTMLPFTISTYTKEGKGKNKEWKS